MTTTVLRTSLTPKRIYFGDGFVGMDAGLDKDGDYDMENVQHVTDHNESRVVHDGDTNDKAPPDVPATEGGNASTVTSDAGVSPLKGGRTLEDATQGLDEKKRRADQVAARRRLVVVEEQHEHLWIRAPHGSFEG
ncbi:hypothetical protein D1007_49300 [Hordeum vulgare]|nr:hypothetical protein D1007_49300 [Hordeum vulgare]